MVAAQQFLNRLVILILSFVLIAAYSYQFIRHRDPCALCFLQRAGMTGIGIALLMNLRFGIRMEHYGLAIISALIGRIFALRQIQLHLCPTIPPLGYTIFGFDLYLWSYFIFTCCLLAIAILLILHGFSSNKQPEPSWEKTDKLIALLFGALILVNIINVSVEI